MGYLDELRSGSFRGVDFRIQTSKKSLGRRAVLHEFPNRDTPYAEDVGRIGNVYEVEGHVVGDNYFDAKRDLERVFNLKGPGELIHPFYGSKMVQVSTVNFSESIIEGAILVFTANFFEAGDNRFPKGVNDKGATLNSAVNAGLGAAVTDFEDNFSVTAMPAFSINSARDLIGAAQEQFDNVTQVFAYVADGIAAAAFATRNLIAEIDDLIQSPGLLAQRLLDSFALMEDAFSRFDDKTSAHQTFFNFGSSQPDVSGNTPIRNRERGNQNALINLMRRGAGIKSSSTAAVANYNSFQDAEKKREEITEVLEEQMRTDEETAIFQSLTDINAALTESLPDIDSDLPNVKEIVLSDVTPSLTLTYDIFESIDNEQDIIDRNGIRNPGFIPPNIPIEVLDE